MVTLGYCQDPNTERAYWSVVVQSWPTGEVRPSQVIGANSQFRGNGGSKTVTAALHMALLELDAKLDDRLNTAEQAALF
jgi:hypothetical protein